MRRARLRAEGRRRAALPVRAAQETIATQVAGGRGCGCRRVCRARLSPRRRRRTAEASGAEADHPDTGSARTDWNEGSGRRRGLLAGPGRGGETIWPASREVGHREGPSAPPPDTRRGGRAPPPRPRRRVLERLPAIRRGRAGRYRHLRHPDGSAMRPWLLARRGDDVLCPLASYRLCHRRYAVERCSPRSRPHRCR